MNDILQWLKANEELSGWAQFFGAIAALLLTYFTAFAPTWRRKKQLRDEALRLLMHGYEIIESFHRTSAHFAPFKLSLRQISITMTAAIDEMGRFPVYELDRNFGPMSFARRLMTMRMVVSCARLLVDTAAEDIGDRTMDSEEHEALRDLIGEQLKFAHNLLMNIPMQRPEWPSPSATTS